jgi:hypothetical protein
MNKSGAHLEKDATDEMRTDDPDRLHPPSQTVLSLFLEE